MARHNSRSAVVTFEDSVGASITVGPGPGDLTVGPIAEGNVRVEPVKNRGTNDGWVEVEELIQDFSITVEAKKESLTSAAAARILDWIRKANFYSGLTSVDSNVWAHKLKWSSYSGAAAITLSNVRVDAVQFAEDATTSKWTISGRCQSAPTYT